jgi:phosphoglycolate phosphatase-like HAD superfamily hydrolase
MNNYNTLIFDCDGVILNSNRIKTEAFYQAALPYGEESAQALVDYHKLNGGISRYIKFAHFLENIKPAEQKGPNLEKMLETYASHVHQGLRCCDIASGLFDLRERTNSSRWLVVSGGDQEEIRQVFAERKLDVLFDGGIFGSPDTKDDILAREKNSGTIRYPAIFFGDSSYDYSAAKKASIEFTFISDWSELAEWEQWCASNRIKHACNINSILQRLL